MPTRSLRLLVVAVVAATAGCGDGETSYAIRDVRVEDAPGAPPPIERSADLRFGSDAHPGRGDLGDEPHIARGRWKFETPDGWTQLPPTRMRDQGWRAGAGAECTLVVIGGGAGGLLANVNRWRKQMSLPPVDDAAVAALPTARWLGRDARRVTLQGTYVGMGGAAPVPDARLVGLVAVLEEGTAFLKLTGPAGVVAAEEPRFAALAASLRRVEAAVPPPDPTSDVGTDTDRPASPSDLAWTAPPEWKRQGEKPMRLVTFSPAAAPEVVVYVTRLGGRAGGLHANLERWYREMGRPAPSAEDVARLERGPVLGGGGVYVEIEGTFSGMGAAPAPGSALLGMVLERESGSVFVKMVGPAAGVRAERARFRAFCESLRE